ncbi:MAG: excisionase family DNA-binding protein [Archangium sp.]|nr:excisionase family DNA-binding protein [Archangium sp.]
MEALPTQQDSEFALAALNQLSPIVGRNGKGPRKLELKPDGAKETLTITLPRDAVRGLLEILAQMANGNAVTIVPVHAEFTTQQAADFLNVSRPFLIALLEEKKIPFRTVGSHRRVRFSDLQAFKQADDQRREQVLAELAEDAQKNDHGY